MNGQHGYQLAVKFRKKSNRKKICKVSDKCVKFLFQNKLSYLDPNYPKADWAKKQHEHKALDGKKTEIHYWENRHTGERYGFKFKNP